MGKDLLTLTVLRRRLGITQEELAAAIPRCSQPDVSMWETGSPIPQEKAKAILRLIQAKDPRTAKLTVADLSAPWDQILLRQNGVQIAS